MGPNGIESVQIGTTGKLLTSAQDFLQQEAATMGRRTYQIATSPGLKFRQRLVLAALAHDIRNRGRLFDPRNMRRLAQEVTLRPIEKFCETLTQEQLADYLTAAHRLDHELQPRQVVAISRSSPALSFLNRFADLRQSASIANASDCYLLTLCHALLAIECNPEELPNESLARRLDASSRLLECIRRRWQPGLDGHIHLPALSLDLLTPFNLRRINAHRLPVKPCLTEKGHRDKSFLPISIPLSAEARRHFPRQAGDGVFTYLCAIPFDHEVLHPAARLRWAIDLTSCLLALQNHVVHIAQGDELLESERAFADAMHGMATNLWDGANGNCWTETLRLLGCIAFATEEVNRARAAAASDTIREASIRFRDVLRLLHVEERWLWDFWDLAPFRHLEQKGAPLRFATNARTSSTLRLWNRNIRNLPTLTTTRGFSAWLASLRRRPSIEQLSTIETTGDLFEERPKTPVISWADRQTIFGQIGSRHRAIFDRARHESRSIQMTDYQAMVENFDRADFELDARARRSTA
jgi:hypothetical protein